MRDDEDLATFEALRRDLFGLAYRMLGDVGRAQDIVQETWLRWHGRDVVADSPRAFLVTIVTRLSLNELSSARNRRERVRSNHLPEPIDLDRGQVAPGESLERISMAFMVMLERLTPAERAVLLLHDVFDFTHDETAVLMKRSSAACRKLLERAHEAVTYEKRLLVASREEHGRLLSAFVHAATAGDAQALIEILATDAVLITDGGPKGRRLGPGRNLDAPLIGGERIATFVAATTRESGLGYVVRDLNGQPALMLTADGSPVAAILLAIADGKVRSIFLHADADRLRHLGS